MFDDGIPLFGREVMLHDTMTSARDVSEILCFPAALVLHHLAEASQCHSARPRMDIIHITEKKKNIKSAFKFPRKCW